MSMFSENESVLGNAQVAVTQPLEKQMELCFGVVPNKSDLPLPQAQKRKRLASSTGDGKKSKKPTPASETIKHSSNAFQHGSENAPATSTFSGVWTTQK